MRTVTLRPSSLPPSACLPCSSAAAETTLLAGAVNRGNGEGGYNAGPKSLTEIPYIVRFWEEQ